MERVVAIGRERRQEARPHHVALFGGRSARDERRGECEQHRKREHHDPERPAAIGEETAQTAAMRARVRGSTYAASTSASRLPATTSVALIVVAAVTTG